MKTLAPGVNVTDSAVTQIVVRAAEGTDGARVHRPKRHLGVEIEDGSATVELELAVDYGKVLPDVVREVQERVAAAVGTMCGVTVTAVHVSVEELQ
ncbi:MAG: Asp23 family, cell envelope-related function [Gaiellaceae bacterium]|nr:Asp23 family, cell envelope-related function [Gaiellaceae bacterium]